MELKDKVKLMTSEDVKDRFKAEYRQLENGTVFADNSNFTITDFQIYSF